MPTPNRSEPQFVIRVSAWLFALSLTAILGAQYTLAQFVVTEIIDGLGDGADHVLDRPTGIAVDAVGNVFVTGDFSDNAFKVTPAGAVTEIIGATGDGAGNLLRGAYAVTVDAAGNAYVVGRQSVNVFKITPAGVITEIIDSAGDGMGNLLNIPTDIAVDAAGNIYVAGEDSNNVFKITPAGVVTVIIDASGDGTGKSLRAPRGVAVDTAGNVYVVGRITNNAFKITPSGVIIEIINVNGDGADNELRNPNRLAVDATGIAYVEGSISRNAFKVMPDGIITEIFDATSNGAGNDLGVPQGIAVDSVGNVYVSAFDSTNPDIDHVYQITPAGIISAAIDHTGDGAGNSLRGATGLAIDSSGRVFVTGLDTDNAFKITPRCNSEGCPTGTTPLVDADGDFAGWCAGASIPEAVDIYVDAVIPGQLALIEVSKDFTMAAPITLTFQQVCADDAVAVPTIYIADESLTNLTGVDWPDFTWSLIGEDDAWFDVAASSGFTVSPFANGAFASFLDPPANQRALTLNATGGVVHTGASFFPGHGSGELAIRIDRSAAEPVFIELVETSTAIHLTGDFDSDGDVDLNDFAAFTLCFGGANAPIGVNCSDALVADCDHDGDVDLGDFAMFALSYSGSR